MLPDAFAHRFVKLVEIGERFSKPALIPIDERLGILGHS
jgi:hypothetical protein